MKVITTRVSRVVTEHALSEAALEQYKNMKGAQAIDSFCAGEPTLVSRTVTYEYSVVYDDKNNRVLEITN
jgi:hypothetical protein